jgi:hypothetical protein
VTALAQRLAALPRRRLEVAVLLTGAGGTVCFVVLRWLVAAHGQLSRFVVAGSDFVSRSGAPGYLYVFAHSEGYDGQFYWRLAADPARLSLAPYLGVRLDSAYRDNRILYSALAWVVSIGHARLAAFALVAVNVVALSALVCLGLGVARRAGRSPVWALALLLAPGLVGALSRDLTEVLTCTLVLGAVLATRDRRYLVAAVAWSAAVLTREEMLAGVAVYALFALHEIASRRRWLGRADLVWTVPVLVLALWQVVVRADAGFVPVFSSAGAGDIGAPFVGFFTSIPGWFSPHGAHQLAKGALFVVQTAAVIALVALVWRNRRAAQPVELALVGVFVLLLVLETKQGWAAPFDARYGALPMVVGWNQLIESPNRSLAKWGVLLVAPVVVLTVLWRVVVI